MKFLTHKRVFIIFLLLTVSNTILTQTPQIEKLLEDQHAESALEILDMLQHLKNNPINPNHASRDELNMIQLISSLSAEKIIQDRIQNGHYHSFQDMAKRLGIDSDETEILRPFFLFTITHQKTRFRITLRTRFQKIVQESAGFAKGAYQGSPWKSYQHVIFKVDQWIKGKVVVEKDAGELLWNDHVSGFLQLGAMKDKIRLILGDFRMEAGQGLVLWGPYGLYKGADPILPVHKKERSIQGFATGTEWGYFSGGGLAVQSTWIDFTFFASRTALDATIQSDGTVSSFYQTGLHRTETECCKRNRLYEIMAGCRLSKSWNWGKLGFTCYKNQYSRKIQKVNLERSRFDFKGRRNHVLGIDWEGTIQRFHFTGEIAQSRSRGISWCANGSYPFGLFEMILSYRDFDADFQNPHSHHFADDDTRNEKGWYWGFSGRPLPHSEINVFIDLLKTPWRTYFIPVPTYRNEWFISWDQNIHQSLNFHLRTKFNTREENDKVLTESNFETTVLRRRQQQNVRFEANWKQSKLFSLYGRYEIVRINYPRMTGEVSCPIHSENGVLVYCESVIQPVKPLKLSLRWIAFQTQSWDSRVYEYERDLPGVLNNPPLYGRGNRWYILISARIGKWFRLLGKVSQTLYHDRNVIGSGYDKIDGNKKKNLGLQLDLRFPK